MNERYQPSGYKRLLQTSMVFVAALLLHACGAPVRPDLPTIVSISQWNPHNGRGVLRIQYRDNTPAVLNQLHCTLEQVSDDRTLGVIEQTLSLPLDAYGTETLPFELPFPAATNKQEQIDYRLICQLQLGKRQETTRYRSTLYQIPAENGLYR